MTFSYAGHQDLGVLIGAYAAAWLTKNKSDKTRSALTFVSKQITVILNF